MSFLIPDMPSPADAAEARAIQQELRGKSVRLHIIRSHVLGVQTIRLIRLRKQQRIQYIRTQTQRGT